MGKYWKYLSCDKCQKGNPYDLNMEIRNICFPKMRPMTTMTKVFNCAFIQNDNEYCKGLVLTKNASSPTQSGCCQWDLGGS